MPAKLSGGSDEWIQVGEDRYVHMGNAVSVWSDGDRLIVAFVGGSNPLSLERGSEAARRILAWMTTHSFQVY